MVKKVEQKELDTHKILSIVGAVPIVLVTIAGLIFPRDIFFWFISSNIAVELLRLGLVAALLWVSVKGKFPSRQTRKTYQLVGAVLLAFSLAAIAMPQMSYGLFGLFKPLDYIIGLQIGVLMLMASMIYPSANGRRVTRTRQIQIPAIPKLRLWAFNVWHPHRPQSGRI